MGKVWSSNLTSISSSGDAGCFSIGSSPVPLEQVEEARRQLMRHNSWGTRGCFEIFNNNKITNFIIVIFRIAPYIVIPWFHKSRPINVVVLCIYNTYIWYNIYMHTIHPYMNWLCSIMDKQKVQCKKGTNLTLTSLVSLICKTNNKHRILNNFVFRRLLPTLGTRLLLFMSETFFRYY